MTILRQQVGSASEFIAVPDVSKRQAHALLQPLLRKYELKPADAAPAPDAKVSGDAPTLGNPAMRIFQPGDDILYGYQILNARQDSAQKPDIEAYVRVFRDGQEILTGEAPALEPRTLPIPNVW